jgi:hypothetical protein
MNDDWNSEKQQKPQSFGIQKMHVVKLMILSDL